MTEQEKSRIADMRTDGKSYAAIASELSISAAAVKSYCIRNSLGGVRSSAGRIPKDQSSKCEMCGQAVTQMKGRKHKRFCSDDCRLRWWACHRDLLKKKTLRTFACRKCGRSFEAYGVKNRDFCGRECYAAYRAGESL